MKKTAPKYRTLCLLSLCFALFGCDIINPEEQIPAFLYIPSVEVDPAEGQGTASSNITEIWVTVDGEFIGAFPIPASVPVLQEGEVELAIQAGIKDNGIGDRPEIYPFYAPHLTNISLQPNAVDTVRPVFEYEENTVFAFVEDFESPPQVFRDVTLGEPGRLSVVSDEVFEGSGALRIDLDTAVQFLEVATVERYPQIVSNNAARVYLEMNYKSEVPAIFGLVGYNGSGQTAPVATEFVAGFRPTEAWKKIYFNLSLQAIQMGNEEYQVVLQTAIPEGSELEEGAVWLDNVKLLHF